MIRLGIIGYGHRANVLLQDGLRTEDSEVRLAGIVDPNEAGVRPKLAAEDRATPFYRSIDELVRKAKPDALLVGTRCNLHTPLAIKAAHYDLPLFLEKPVAVSIRQAVALEKAFEKSRCEVVVSFPLRVTPLCVMARKCIEETVGTPEHVTAVNYVSYGTVYWQAGYRDFAVTQGLFLQKATHDFDYISMLMGSPVTRVAAMASYGRVFGGKKPTNLVCSRCEEQEECLESPQNRKRNGSGDAKDHLCVFSKACGSPGKGMNEDASSALLEFASGAHGVYTQVFFARRNAHARGATVSGYQGTVSFDWYRNEIRRVRHHAPFTDTIGAGEGQAHFGGDAELSRNFLDVIRGRARSRTPINLGLQSAYACLAAKESAKTGRFVKVRQVGE